MILLLFIIKLCFAYNEQIAKQSIDLSQAAYCVTDKWNCFRPNTLKTLSSRRKIKISL